MSRSLVHGVRRQWGLHLILPAAVLLVLGLVWLVSESMLGAIAALVLGGILCAAAALGMERSGLALIIAGMAVAPIFGPRFALDFITATDVFFSLGFLLLLPRLLQTQVRIPTIYLAGLGILLVFSLVASLFFDQLVFSLIRIARFYLAIAVLPIAFMLLQPSMRLVRVLAWAYVGGHTLSLLYGLAGGGEGTDRLYGLTTHPNAFAVCALLALGLLYYLDQHTTGWWRVMVWGLIGAHVIGLGMSGSRGGLGALAVIVLVAAIRERSWKLLYGLASGATALAVVAPLVLSRLDPESAPARLLNPAASASASGSDSHRSDLIGDGIEAFFDSPIIGSGYGGVYTFFYHNVYLQIAVAAGVFGFVGFMMVVWSVVRPVLDDDTTHRMAYGAVGYFAAAFFLNTIWDRFVWAVLSLILATHVMVRQREEAGEATAPPGPRPRPPRPAPTPDRLRR